MDIRRNRLRFISIHHVLRLVHGHFPHGGHLSRAPLRTQTTTGNQTAQHKNNRFTSAAVRFVCSVLVRYAAVWLVALFA